jgi:alpha-tubulin suppressor-like RCC1 family protein
VHDGIAQIEAMGSNTCVRTVDGEIYCWGANAWGQLGQGHVDPIGDGPDELANLNPVDLGPDRYAIDLTLGNEFTCALLDDHTVRCWGRNGFGQLGQGTTQARGDGPGEMGAALVTTDLGPGTVVDVESGGQHSCALFDDGTIKCWGHSSDGKIGLGAVGHTGDGPGEMGTALPVVNLGSGLLVRSLAVGTVNNCAIMTTGQWKCWGSNANGANANNQITGAQGDNIAEMGNTLTFRSLPNSGVPAQLELGSQGGCAITTCGAVHCWGENATGRVGVGNTAIQRLPAAAVALPAGRLAWEDDVCP